jgi:KipI family sensor histidine kinase inhibitor
MAPAPRSGEPRTGEPRTVLPCGDRAVLVELPRLADVLALYRGLAADPLPGIVDMVPAARTILVTVDPQLIGLPQVRRWLQDSPALYDAGTTAGRQVIIEVDYSGPDLDAVAGHLGITVREVIRLHTGSVWTAAFTGFAPGFAYLVTDHGRLAVPRREAPRTTVPAGAVGLAGEFSGIYPRPSPGGWQLLGTTDAVLWDPAAEQPALLAPGTVVRFREV